jgi:hypothetical protein
MENKINDLIEKVKNGCCEDCKMALRDFSAMSKKMNWSKQYGGLGMETYVQYADMQAKLYMISREHGFTREETQEFVSQIKKLEL